MMGFGEARNEVEKEVCAIEKQISELKQKAKELLKELPPEEVQNYELKNLDGSSISMQDLFGDKEELILIHNMGPGCPYCTLWADGLTGFTAYFNDRCAFWLETDKDAANLKTFAVKRNWNFNVVSSEGSTLKLDLGYQVIKDGKKDNWPGFSTFFKKDGKIFRHATAPFGPGDEYCAVWPMFDRLKNGVNGWQPKFNSL